MRKAILLFTGLFFFSCSYAQESYKSLINDLDVNFYDVCAAAEAHFNTINKDKKGSGYKGFLRWKNNNEYKYYPSGKRNNIDPFFVAHAFNTHAIGNQSISFQNGWKELGPFVIDSISGHYAAGLGRVEDHYVDPNDTNVMYLGSRSGGFWKTTNGGLTWEGGSTDTLMACGVNTIAVSPTNHDSILINVRNSRNGYSHGIYRSIDGGSSWDVSNFNPSTIGFGGLGSNFKISSIVYHPRLADVVFIGTNKGIYRSLDNLLTWTNLYPTADVTDIKFHPTNDSLVYILDNYSGNNVRDYVFYSTNLGTSYTPSTQVPNNNNKSGKLSISQACPNCVYFASNDGVWKSTDNGQNFNFLSNPSQSAGGFSVNNLDTSNMIYGYVDIVASTDGGNTFNQVTWWALGNSQHGSGGYQSNFNNSTAYVHADLHPAKCVNGSFYVGTDGTFSKSTDGGNSWQILNQGTAIRENYKLGVSQSNHYRSMSGSQDNGTSIKLRDTWLEFYGADGMEAIIHPLNDDWMMSSLQYGGRRKTTDGGQTQSSATPPNNGSAQWEAPLAYDPNNPMRIYDFRDSIYVSEDFGNTWAYKGEPSSFTGVITQAAIAENNANIIIIARNQYIEKSFNGGASFASIKSNLPNYTIKDIAFDPKNDNNIIVTYARYQNDNSKVFLTTNGGTSWTNITYNLGDMPIHSVVIDHTDSSNIYLGAEIGVYTKTMNASSWSLYNPNLPNTTIEELEIVNGSNTLKAATWGRGLWEFNLVNRASYPSIVTTKITDQPTLDIPREGVNQFVTSVISYDYPLDTVFLKWSINTPTFDSMITMNNTMDSTWVSQTELPNYPAGTKMYFKIFAVGNNQDTTETYKFMYTVRPFEYCIGTGNNGSGNLFISNLSVANINNTSTNDAYTLYNDSVVYLFIDSTYAISLSANNSWSSNDVGAWIDFNNNAIFDSSETLGLPSFTGNVSQSSFTVPTNSNTSDTLRLRARLSYYGSISDPCGNTLGEVEDYPLLIISEPTLRFNISNSIICQGNQLLLNYTGNAVDSVVWNFTNGSTNYSKTGINDSILLPAPGSYSLHLVAYIHGFPFTLDSSNVVWVNPMDLMQINLTSCNAMDTGIVVQNFTNALGCDSVVTTITTLLPNDSITITTGSCVPADVGSIVVGFINSSGCDSVVTTITSLFPTDSILIHQVSCIANEIGTQTQVLSNIFGCDSVVTTLTVADSINANVSQTTNVLTAVPAGLSYQWVNCDSNFLLLPGDTNQVFTAINNGDYAVIIRDEACIDTSSCIQVMGLSLDDLHLQKELVIYPNPTHDEVIIQLDRRIPLSEFHVFNVIGEDVTSHIVSKNVSELEVQMNFNQVASGVYFIRTKSTINKITKY